MAILQWYKSGELIHSIKPGVFDLFRILYPLPSEKRIIYPQCDTFTFLILKIEVCFSLYFGKITPSVGKIYPQGVHLPPVKNPWIRQLYHHKNRPAGSVVKRIAVGAGDTVFDSRPGQIGHCVANGSPLLQGFFVIVFPRR